MAKKKKQDQYRFFGRDISWLSFNKRVLLEALDVSVPIYERLNFLSIFSSNLEEFYQVRVASERAAIQRLSEKDSEESRNERIAQLKELTNEVKRQEALFKSVWEDVMVKDLQLAGVQIITNFRDFTPEIQQYAHKYFDEEIFPFIEPVLLSPNLVRTFIRDKRVYLCVQLRRHFDGAPRYYILKIPFTKVPRFLSLPSADGKPTYTFVDEVLRSGLPSIFPGYDVIDAYSFKLSRDADIIIDEDEGGEELAESIEDLIRKRKIGNITRFQYDEAMPEEMLKILCDSFDIKEQDLLAGRRHLQLQDVRKLPNPLGKDFAQQYPAPLPHTRWDQAKSKIDHILHQDEALFVPYTSFSYLLQTLSEAAQDPRVKGIKLTQYRVADDSEVIDQLIKAANSGKEVTVFVELKARFDEEHNLQTAQRMIRHGIKIIYSLPGLKVHAKTCFIEFHPEAVLGKVGIACFSTGNFNEKTAKIYSDVSIFTSRIEQASELQRLFLYLEEGVHRPQEPISFDHLLVASVNMVERIHELIDFEIKEAKAGRPAKITLKMNSLEETGVITKLYEASEAGVEVNLLIRGICRAIPNQSFSKNIRIIRLVDIYLEHARIWYFHHGGEELYFVSSADWMTRNLYRRIECAAPVVEPKIKEFLGEVLELCMQDNVNAVYLSEELENVPKRDNSNTPIRTQMEMYNVVDRFVSQPNFHDEAAPTSEPLSVEPQPVAQEATTTTPQKRKHWWQRLFGL